MAESQLLIRLPEDIDEMLDADARRCRRSKTKQVEAILVEYYGINHVELGEVDPVRDKVSPELAATGRMPRIGPRPEGRPIAASTGGRKLTPRHAKLARKDERDNVRAVEKHEKEEREGKG